MTVPADIAAGVASRSSIVHASQDASPTNSRGHTEVGISRIQSAVHIFSILNSYIVDDLVRETGITYRNVIPTTPGLPFNVTQWEIVNTVLPVSDSTPIVNGSIDDTKLLRFEIDGFTTGTTRVLTPPDADGTLPLLEATQTFTGNNTFTEDTDVIKNSTALVNATAFSNVFAFAGFTGFRARGTQSTPLSIQSGDVIVDFDARGHDGTAFQLGGFMGFSAGGNWTGSSNPTIFEVATTDIGSTSTIINFTVGPDGTASFQDNTIQDIASIKLNDSDDSNSYTILGGALSADFNVTIPAIATDENFVLEDTNQTLTNKTIDANSNTITNIGSSEVDSGIITGQALKGSPIGADQILISDSADSGNLKKIFISSLPGGGATAPPFIDTVPIIEGSIDDTKLLRFEVDGFTTGTTIVLTPQDQDGTIALLEAAQTFTVKQTMDIPLSTIADGLSIGNADGGMLFGNDTASVGEFASIVDLFSVGNTNPNTLQARITAANDVGTVPVLRLNVERTGTATITTRPLLQIQNNGSTKISVAASGITSFEGNDIDNINSIKLQDSDDSNKYTILGDNLAGDFDVTIPTITVNENFVLEDTNQTLTTKTIDAASNTITNIGSSEVTSSIITGQTSKPTPVGADEILLSDSADSGNLKRATLSSLDAALPVPDTTSIVEGSVDATKLLRFEIDGFSPSTTRVLTPQDQDGTIALLEASNIFTQDNTFEKCIAMLSSIPSTTLFMTIAATNGQGPILKPQLARGTLSGFIDVQNNDRLFFMNILGYESGFKETAQMVWNVDGNWTETNHGSSLTISTTPVDTIIREDNIIIKNRVISFEDNDLDNIKSIKLNDSDDTHSYTILGDNLAGDFDVTIPTITANDTFAMLGVDNTFTKDQTIGTTAATDLTLIPPTIPTGSSSDFTANLAVSSGTIAFATTPQTGDFIGTNFAIQTLTNPSSGTITDAATLRIAGAPLASTNVTITNNAALHVVAGLSRFDGNIQVGSGSSINDSNGNELIVFPSVVASAVNEITISNSAAASPVTLTASGDDANIDVRFIPKGTGTFYGVRETFAWPLIDETTAPTVAVHYTTVPAPYDMTIEDAIGGLTVAGTGAALFTLDVLKEDSVNANTFTTIFSTTITIDASEFTSTTAATPPVISVSTWEKGRRLQLSVTQLDSNTLARGPKIELITHATAK